MRIIKHRLLKRAFQYKKDKDGATAIEFALLAIPFFMLLFAILEVSIIFFISSTMSHAVSEASRQIRTGNFQSCGPEEFKALVCNKMASLAGCEQRVRIDVVSDTSFKTITLPAAPEPPEIPPPPAPQVDPDIPNGLYAETGASAPVIVRALFYYKLVLPTELTRLENVEGTRMHRITATTAFQNEPFPTQSCPTPA